MRDFLGKKIWSTALLERQSIANSISDRAPLPHWFVVLPPILTGTVRGNVKADFLRKAADTGRGKSAWQSIAGTTLDRRESHTMLSHGLGPPKSLLPDESRQQAKGDYVAA